jgi:hypothetical protein
MKKFYLLALICLPFALKAQNGVVFKIKYQPNKSYKMNVGLGMKITANVTGDPEILQKLKDEGITQPVMALLGLGVDATIKTGAAGSDNMMPMTMDFKIDSLNVLAAGKQVPIPPSATDKAFHFAGRVSPDNTSMTIDSVNGKKTNDSTQKSMKQMMSMVQRQIQFPTTPMKPGDTFTQNLPINVPVKGTGGNMQVNASITYKLNSISDGKAYFDVTPKFTMDFNMKKVAVNMSGTGTGKMVYSITDNFPVSREGTFNMTIKVTSTQINVDGTAVVNTSSKVDIN